MTQDDRQREVERQEFLIKYPWANRWDFNDYKAHKASGGQLPDPRESEEWLTKKAIWEARYGA
ncbi:MAG TPA: hypothetical protein V6D12_13630 [Candidatus Obscuribacterales bacterium]